MSTTCKIADAELPDGWRMVRLADVFTLEYGVSLPERKRRPGEVPVLGSAGIVGFHSESAVEGPGVVVGRKGSIGSVTWIDEAFVPIDTTYYVCPNPLCADLRWLYYVLGRENLSVLNRATGVPGLNRDDVYALRRPIPSMPEQRAIADVLDSIDAAIERTEAVIAATEILRDSLLHELLTRGVPGWHTEWKDVPGIGTIPADWEVVRLEDVASVERGKFAHRPRNEPRFYGGCIPFIQTGDVVRAVGVIRIHTQTLNDSGLSISRLFPTGTVVITIAANIGETAVASYPIAFPDSLVGIIATGIDGRFLEYYLRTQKPRLERLAPESAQKNINLEDLRPLLVPVPGVDEQTLIAEQLGAVQSEVDSLQALLVDMRTLKTTVAGELLSGRAGTRTTR